ncbi:hypothetical protein ABE073_05055 [Lederbergia citrisecunda]|uniref:hypothetical protein n=1 Tax=Lederbergia citrisecunda TaxID=2833583 RepID=UPI003D2C268D
MSTKVNELYQELGKLIEQGYGDCKIYEVDDVGHIDGIGKLELGLLVKNKEYSALEFYSFENIEIAKSAKKKGKELIDYHRRLLVDIENDKGETVVVF